MFENIKKCVDVMIAFSLYLHYSMVSLHSYLLALQVQPLRSAVVLFFEVGHTF